MNKFIIIFAIVVIAGIGLFGYFILPEWSCETQGGRWDTIGLSLDEYCNLPTSDVGKECSDSDECEGSCIAELSEEESRQEIVYTKGKCSEWKRVVGCLAFVEDGKVEGIFCAD